MDLMRLLKGLRRIEFTRLRVKAGKLYRQCNRTKAGIYLAAVLIIIPVFLLLQPVAAVQKIIKHVNNAKQVTAVVPQEELSGEAQQPAAANRAGGSETSRGRVDRSTVNLLAQVIEGEAADEPYQGKVAVGAVILNRTESAGFPNTIPGVIYEPDAFESVTNGQYQRPVSEESMNAAIDALNGSDPTGGALYFWNPAKAVSTWVWSRPIVTQIGRHVFAR